MRSSLSRYALIAKRWTWVIVLGIVICGSSTFIVTKLLRPVYQASALLIVNVGTSTSSYDNATASLELLPTYAQLINTPKVLGPVAAKHPGVTIKAISDMLTVKPQSNTQIIEIDIENYNPRIAAQYANEISQSFAQFSTSQLGGAQIQVIPAQVPVDPVRPRPTQDSLVGALVGLGLALMLIVIFEWLDDRLASPEEVQTLLGLDILTTIPALSRKERMRSAEETPALAEGCRILCANLSIAHQATHPCKLLMVTSALSGEGKSTIAANIATFLAMSGKRVLLVDADLRHPVLDQHFQLENGKGLSNTFLEMWAHIETDLEGQATEIPSLRVLTSGVLPSNPSELLQSQLAHKLFAHFTNTQQFDFVIFDTPPVLPVADAQILASYIPAVLVVVDATKTSRRALLRTKQIVSRTGAHIIGVALNKSRWPDMGELRDYQRMTQSRPRADIMMALPADTSPAHQGLDSADTAVLPTPSKR